MHLRTLMTFVTASILAVGLFNTLATGESAAPTQPNDPAASSPTQPNDPAPQQPATPWTKIAAKDAHLFDVAISGWTIFSLQAGGESPLEIYLFDANGNMLAAFDSTGCGAFLQLDKPQVISVMILNASADTNEYVLHVYDT